MLQNIRKAMPMLGVLAVCVWFLYTFHRYMPGFNNSSLREVIAFLSEMLSRWRAVDIFLVALVWLAAYLWGRKFLTLIGISLAAGTERLWLASTLGLSLLSLAVFLLATLHLLYDLEAFALVLLPVVIRFREVRQIAATAWNRRFWRAAPQPFTKRRFAHFALIAYIAVVLAIVFLSALAPEIEYDPLSMHLYASRTIAQEHGLKAIPEVPQTFLPKNVTMLFTLGLLLHSQITVKLINFLLGLLALVGAYTLAAKLFSRSTGLVAVAVLASSPLLMWEMRTAHLDAGFTLFVFLSLFATLHWLESSQRTWFHLAVYATAFSLGTKYQALFPLGALATAVLLNQFMKRAGWYASFVRAAKFFLLSLLGLVPWAIVNLIQTGNPLFPFLNDIFHSPYWTELLTERVIDQMNDSGIPITVSRVWGVLTNFWHMGLAQADFHGNIGPFFVLLIPLLLFHRQIHLVIKLLLCVSLVYWLLWLLTGQHARYFLAALPGLAIVAAYALVNFLDWVRLKVNTPLAAGVGILLFSLAVLNSPFFESYGANPRYGGPILETVPGKFLLGQESQDTYLSRYLMDYPVVQYLNQLPGKKKVLFSWDCDPIAYYVNGETAFVYSFYFDEFGGQNSAELSRVLRENQITHLVIGQQFANSLFYSDPEKEFVQRYLKKIYQRNAIILYEVASQPLRQEFVAYDFLNRINDATIKMPAEPSAKPNGEYRGVYRIAEEDRYALVTYPPAEVSFQVALPEYPVLRFGLGRRWAPCLAEGSFQLWLQTAQGEKMLLFDRRLSSPNALHDVGWYDEELDLNQFARQSVTVTFKTAWLEDNGTCDWFLWADPQIISQPPIAGGQPVSLALPGN